MNTFIALWKEKNIASEPSGNPALLASRLGELGCSYLKAPCWQPASLICIANPSKAGLVWQELKKEFGSLSSLTSQSFLGFR